MKRSEFVKFRAHVRKDQENLWNWYKVTVQSTDKRIVFAGLGRISMLSFELCADDRIECKLWRPDGLWVNQRFYDEAWDANRRLAIWVHDETEEDW